MANHQKTRAAGRSWALAAALSATLFVGGIAQAEETASTPTTTKGSDYAGDVTPDGTAMAADLVFARPLGIAATVLGSAFFVVGLPFAALAGDINGPARKLIVEPAQFTFTRPLGQMDR